MESVGMEALNALEDAPIVDKVADVMDTVADAIPPKARTFLGGDWLGHPLHPVLTDLPIGFWTSSFFLDFFGGRRRRRTSAAFVGMGVASAVPTVAAGLVEFQKLPFDTNKRKIAVVHTAANALGTLLYALSFLARLRGSRYKGVMLGLLGATAVTAGGYLGGQLAFAAEEATDESRATEAEQPTRDRNQMRLAV